MRDVTGYRTNVAARQHRVGGVIPCFRTVHNTLKPSCRRTARVTDRSPIVPAGFAHLFVVRRAVEYRCHYSLHPPSSDHFASPFPVTFRNRTLPFLFIFSHRTFFSTTVQQTRRRPRAAYHGSRQGRAGVENGVRTRAPVRRRARTRGNVQGTRRNRSERDAGAPGRSARGVPEADQR